MNSNSKTLRDIVIVVRIEGVLKCLKPGPYALCNEIAMNNLDLLITKLEEAGHKVHVILNSNTLTACVDIPSYKAEFPNSVFSKRLSHVIPASAAESFSSLVIDMFRATPVYAGCGFAVICAASDFPRERNEVTYSTVCVGKNELFGSDDIDQAMKIAQNGDRVFRVSEIDVPSMNKRTEQIQILEGCLFAANHALASMNVVGKHVEFKTELELESDARGFADSETFYKDSIAKAKEQFELVFKSIEDAHAAEVARIAQWSKASFPLKDIK
jgi:hypothetical protein